MTIRFYKSYAPRFGSYLNPIKWKIEESHYYFWWLALTLNEDYRKFCASKNAKKKDLKQMLKIYEDFGDVSYVGDKHIAFTKWWLTKMPNGETRGEYLFAEKQTGKFVQKVSDIETAKALLADENELLIRIPKVGQRRHIDKAINRILKKEMTFVSGKQSKRLGLSESTARYRLSKPTQVRVLKAAFALYEEYEKVRRNGAVWDANAAAKAVGLIVKTRPPKDEVFSSEDKERTISVAVSRKKGMAIAAIANVIWQFP